MGIEQFLTVTDDGIPGNGIDAVADAAPVDDFLSAKGYQNGGALGGQGSGFLWVYPHRAIGQGGIQTILLPILHGGKLAEVGAANADNLLGVAVQGRKAVGGMHQRHIDEHHALVAGGQVIQKLLGLGGGLLQAVGDVRAEIPSAVLLGLEPCPVGVDGEHLLLYQLDGLIGGNGDDVDGENHIAVKVGEVGNHFVLDEAGIVGQKEHAPEAAADGEVVGLKLHGLGANSIPEVMAPAHGRFEVKGKLTRGIPVEVVEKLESIIGGEGRHLGGKPGESLFNLNGGAVKEGAGVLDVLPCHREGDVFLLHGGVAARRHVVENAVILPAVDVQPVSGHGDVDGVGQGAVIEAAIVDGDFGGGLGVQAVEDGRVIHEHIQLVIGGCHAVIDIPKGEGFGVLPAGKENPIRVNPLDGNGVLCGLGDAGLVIRMFTEMWRHLSS